MTHELRTPVATVSAAVQALQNYVEMGDKEHRDLYLSISKEELDHLSVMIDNVLHVAEDEHHTTYKLQYQYYDIITLIKKCISSVQIQDSDKQLDFVFNPTNTVEMVYGDPEHIKNVITNLLENAVKYGATQISIFTGVDRKNQFVVLRITDNGMGIPYAYQHQVFEPFFRVPQGNLHNVKGFGLGLSYVKQVVLQHGGHIQLKSVPNEGSSFTLSIPKTATL
ncbi:sensor histidine kinase [Parapedobacter tibetensis]|uniref:sensor histidine kinase n=1 Tax=Parapedobacter tibetensis TaxID=2972951 RepID=UPI00214D5023|nr:HAMP domain-containing sensor histidine kinase [Parapedobacter tibetensis]